MFGRVEWDDRGPGTVFLSGRLEIHSAIAGVFCLSCLSSHRPFAIGGVHAGLDLGENHFCDVWTGWLARTIQSRHFAEATTLKQGNRLSQSCAPFTGRLPRGHVALENEIQPGGPFYSV